MFDRLWMVDDAFGRQWRLWIASRGATGGMRDDRARTAIRGLVWAATNARHDRYDRASATLLALHAELTGGSLSRYERDPASLGSARLGSARLMWERISEALECATASGRLRIEQAMRFQPTFVLEDAPDTLRDLDAPTPSPPRLELADWVGIEAEIAKTDRDKRLLRDDFTMPLQLARSIRSRKSQAAMRGSQISDVCLTPRIRRTTATCTWQSKSSRPTTTCP